MSISIKASRLRDLMYDEMRPRGFVLQGFVLSDVDSDPYVAEWRHETTGELRTVTISGVELQQNSGEQLESLVRSRCRAPRAGAQSPDSAHSRSIYETLLRAAETNAAVWERKSREANSYLMRAVNMAQQMRSHLRDLIGSVPGAWLELAKDASKDYVIPGTNIKLQQLLEIEKLIDASYSLKHNCENEHLPKEYLKNFVAHDDPSRALTVPTGAKVTSYVRVLAKPGAALKRTPYRFTQGDIVMDLEGLKELPDDERKKLCDLIDERLMNMSLYGTDFLGCSTQLRYAQSDDKLPEHYCQTHHRWHRECLQRGRG